MWHVRRADVSDVEQVATHLRVLDFDDHHFYDLETVRERCEAPETIVLVSVSEETGLVGGAMVLQFEDQSCQIEALGCLPESQGRGAGAALIRAAVEHCRRHAIPKLWCWSMETYGAERFYRSLGFHEEILLKRQFFGEDCWFFGQLIER